MSGLLSLDERLFQLINGRWHVDWLDRWVALFTGAPVLATLGGLLLGGLLLRQGRRAGPAVLAVVLALTLTDVSTARLLKPAFHRPRPCRGTVEGRLLVPCNGRNGFPSNHAANAAAVAAVLLLFYPRSWRAAVPFALAVGWSRVYVGVHYPGDVLAGFVWGAALGGAVGAGLRHRLAPVPRGIPGSGPPGVAAPRNLG